MMPHFALPRVGAILSVLLLLAACNGDGSRKAKTDLGALAKVGAVQGDGFALLYDGKGAEALDSFTAELDAARDATRKAQLAFGLGEAAYYNGDYNASLTAHIEAIKQAPQSPLAAWSLLRLTELRNLASNFDPLAVSAIEGVRAGGEKGGATALSRYMAARLSMSMAVTAWNNGPSEAPFDGSAVGVPTFWRAVGPSSLYGNLDIDETTPMEADPQLADSYTLMDFERKTWDIFATGAVAEMTAPVGGVYLAETWLTLDAPGRFDLAGDFVGQVRVFIDGEEVLSRDDRGEFLPTKIRLQGLELSAGTHQVRVRMVAQPRYKSTFGVMFLPEDPNAELRFEALKPDGAMGSVVSAGKVAPWMGPNFGADKLEGKPLLQGLAAMLAVEVLDEGVARAALKMLREQTPAYVAGPMLEAELAHKSWALPSAVRNREVLDALRRAVVLSPGASRARLWLASVLRSQSLKDDTAAEVAVLIKDGKDEAANWLEAWRYYAWRGWEAKAEAALAQALKLDPADCYTASRLFDVWNQRTYTAPPGKMPEAFSACSSVRWHYETKVGVLQGDVEASLNFWKRSVSRRPDLATNWRSYAEALAEHRSVPEAISILDRAMERFPRDAGLVDAKASMLERLGKLEDAQKVLRDGLALMPGSWTLQRHLALSEGRTPLQELMSDGKAAIAAFDSKTAPLKSSAVYVLDYMARRYFEEGSSADVTHLVIKVLAKEGIDQFGEVSFPRGAVPLMIRTVKQDGQIIEAQPQQGKATVSMPSLDVGDYIEYAYLTINSRNIARRGAMIGPSFYFQMSRIASAHSEFVLEVPNDWDVSFVPMHEPPKAKTSDAGAWRRYQFLRKGSSQPRPEPNRVEDSEFLPHVQMIHRYGWEDSHKIFQNRLGGAQALSTAIRARANTLTKGIKSPEAKIKTLFRFVGTHVREASFRDFTTPAAHVEQSGVGNPIVLLQALLRAEGIDSEVVMIKGQAADPVDTIIPELQKYAFISLKVSVPGGGELWLNPASRYSPFGILPSSFQGSPTISIEPGASMDRFDSPTFDPALARRDIQFDLDLDEKGTLTGVIEETLRGYRATSRRNQYDELASDDKMRKFMERVLNTDISGGELLNYTIEGRDDPDAALTLRITFKRPGYARLAPNGTLVIEDRYDMPDMTRRYARLPQRESMMLLGRRWDEKVSVSLRAPEGFRVEGPGGRDELEYKSDFGSYTRTVVRSGNTLDVSHRLMVPVQRVTPWSYAAFREWCGDIDRATYARIVTGSK